MSSFRITTAAAVGLLAAIASARAATEHDTVIVTATRTAQTVDDTLAPVIVIDRAAIERSGAADLTELLQFHAGIDVARNGGPGQSTSVFLRGTESNHVLLLLDGVKLNPATIGQPAYQNIRPEQIERIEIVKGPRSALYGSEAIGGVINIITRRGTSGLSIDAGAGAGRYHSYQADASAHYRAGRDRFGIAVSHHRTDGFPTFDASTVDRGHDNTGVNAYAGTAVGPLDVELSHWEARGTTEYAETDYDPNTFAFLGFTAVDQDFVNRASALKLGANPLPAWSTTLQLSQSAERIDQNQSADFAHTTRNLLEWQNDVQIGSAQLLSAGLSLTRENATALSTFRVDGSSFRLDEDTTVKAAYVQDDVRIGRHHALFALRHTDHETAGMHNDWSVEYGFDLTPATRLTAGAGTAFRAPDSTDRFGIGGNPDLEPETARNLELGLRHRLDARQELRLNAFDNRIDDLIGFDFDPTTFQFLAANIDRARIRGLEAGYDYAAGPWQAHIEAIVQNPRDRNTGERLLRRAPRSLSASLVRDFGRWDLGADVLAAAARDDVDAILFTDTHTAGYALVNLTARADLARDWQLRARVENLFDRDYEQVSGYRTPGRGLYVELRYAPRGKQAGTASAGM